MADSMEKDATENIWKSSDMLIKARVQRTEINLLVKFVEGLGHLGVVTTINPREGEVLIQTTRDCWPELKKCLRHLPIEIAL